jgi:hypothetical protein
MPQTSIASLGDHEWKWMTADPADKRLQCQFCGKIRGDGREVSQHCVPIDDAGLLRQALVGRKFARKMDLYHLGVMEVRCGTCARIIGVLSCEDMEFGRVRCYPCKNYNARPAVPQPRIPSWLNDNGTVEDDEYPDDVIPGPIAPPSWMKS